MGNNNNDNNSAVKIVKNIAFRIYRWDGANPDDAPQMKVYEVPVYKGMTVLEGLIYIKHYLDQSISYRASCRMGVCGSCGMMINGKPLLACQQQILKLETDTVELRPLANYPVVKDLVPDLTRMIVTHQAIKPFIIRRETPPEEIGGEFHQSVEELVNYLQFSYCIKCGMCMSACPTVGSLPEFHGPQPLGQALRYINDTRDEGFEDRLAVMDTAEGIFRCHFAGACSEACPKGIDPAFAIQLLKGEIVRRGIFRKKAGASAALMPLTQENPPRRENIPTPPPRTVE
ncbi:MAG: succinate dehydrogenase iron-sulfur subunit [Acidobacteria bacterium]|nr:succinate dehydrogenase iron-sulfur subunit [Acidobacteriota bacterium]